MHILCCKIPYSPPPTNMDAPPTTTVSSGAISIKSSVVNEERPTTVSLQEWQAWGTNSPLPKQVSEIVQEIIVSDAHMKFGGLGGKIKVLRIQSYFIIVDLIMFDFSFDCWAVFYFEISYMLILE